MHRQLPAMLMKPLSLAGVLLLSCATPLVAQDTDSPSASSDSTFGWERPDLDVELTLEARRASEQEPDLNLTSLESEVLIKARQKISADISLRADLVLEANSYSEAVDGDDTSEWLYSFEKLYVQKWDAQKRNRWRVGRQSLEDEMTWFIDEDLDGLQFTNRSGSRQLDLSFTRQQWVLLGNEERDDEVDNVLAQLSVEGLKGTVWSPYILFRKDRGLDDSRPSESTWLGLQGIVRLNKNLQYWLNASLRRGEEERNSGDRKLGGRAVDAGITWTLESRFKPSLTVGYAHGSGDTDVSDSRDDTFRQSGLQSNKFELNGRNRFRYLGEVVDPELTNINILTVGAGFRLSKRWDLDVALHRYAQDEAEDNLRGSVIVYDPAGVERDLGDGVDVVLGYQHKSDLEVQGLLGLFRPGSAFEEAEDAPEPLKDVWVARLKIEYEF